MCVIKLGIAFKLVMSAATAFTAACGCTAQCSILFWLMLLCNAQVYLVMTQNNLHANLWIVL